MPPHHVRDCTHCGHTRYAACARTCRIPTDLDPTNWRPYEHSDCDGVAPELNPS